MTAAPVVYPRDTVEYVSTTLIDTTGADISEDTVELAIHRGEPTEWLAAVWGDEGVIRTTVPVSFDQATYPYGLYTVSARVTDTAEVPIVRVGTLAII